MDNPHSYRNESGHAAKHGIDRQAWIAKALAATARLRSQTQSSSPRHSPSKKFAC